LSIDSIITIKGADMKANSICFSGFSREDEASVAAVLSGVNARLSKPWSLLNENDAHLVVIDMDTVYGYMTWLKAQSAGKITAAVTTSERSDANYVLPRPLNQESLYALLKDLSDSNATEIQAMPAIKTSATEVVAPVANPVPAAPPAALVKPSATEEMARVTGQQPAMPPLSAKPAALKLMDFLKPDALKAASRLQISGSPDLVIDPLQQVYYGGNLLKPLMPYASAVLTEQDFTTVTPAELEQLQRSPGAAQPLSRLNWLAHLLGHGGELCPGARRNEPFHLSKWPTSEREFPKHFRIATVMIKEPIKLGDVATQTGANLHDVIDFVNANIATGHIRI
jgi:hypothetical protein